MSKYLLLGDTLINRFPAELIGNDFNKTLNASYRNIDVLTYHKLIMPKVLGTIEEVDCTILQIGLDNIINIIKCNKLESLNEVIENIKDLIVDVNNHTPRLIVVGICSTRNRKLNEIIKLVNEKLEEECFYMSIDYLNLYDLMLDNNDLLKRNYTTNGIKITENGYRLIANQINEFILMNDINYFK